MKALGNPGSGGEAFIIGQRDDGTAIFTITAFARPTAKAPGTARGRPLRAFGKLAAVPDGGGRLPGPDRWTGLI